MKFSKNRKRKILIPVRFRSCNPFKLQTIDRQISIYGISHARLISQNFVLLKMLVRDCGSKISQKLARYLVLRWSLLHTIYVLIRPIEILRHNPYFILVYMIFVSDFFKTIWIPFSDFQNWKSSPSLTQTINRTRPFMNIFPWF